MSFDEDINLLKCLGEETKHQIVKSLLNKELCACEIPPIIGRTQSNTSMHLAKLVKNNILKSRREGKKIIYSIKNKKVKKIIKVLK